MHDMKELILTTADSNERKKLYKVYRTLPLNKMFPIIGSKILDINCVYRISISGEKAYLVISCLGFCQLIHMSKKIKNSMMLKNVIGYSGNICETLNLKKLRFYPTANIDDTSDCMVSKNISVSSRQRYMNSNTRKADSLMKTKPLGIKLYYAENIKHVYNIIPREFIYRFWDNWEEFVTLGDPVVATYKGSFASICYSASVFNGYSEIDIYTDSEHRNKGIAKEVAIRYILNMTRSTIMPLWDCFSNNLGSTALADTLGFKPVGNRYNFYTVSNS